MIDLEGEMAASKFFYTQDTGSFCFDPAYGLDSCGPISGGTTETSDMNQISNSEENKYVSQTYTIVLINNSFSPEITEIHQYCCMAQPEQAKKNLCPCKQRQALGRFFPWLWPILEDVLKFKSLPHLDNRHC